MHRKWLSFSLYLLSGWTLSLTQFHTLQHKQEPFLWLVHFETSSELCQGMCFLKVLLSVLIYPYRSWCPIYKQLHRGLSLKKILSNTPLCFPEILHHFWSRICQQHILIINSIVLPLTSLEIQVSHKLCKKPKIFDHLIKAYIPTPRCLLQS